MVKVQGVNMTIVEAIADTHDRAIREVNEETGPIELQRVSVCSDGSRYAELKSGIDELGEVSGIQVEWGAGVKYMQFHGLWIYQSDPIMEDGNESEII